TVGTSGDQAAANVDDWVITLSNVSSITVVRTDSNANAGAGTLQFLTVAHCDLDTDGNNIPVAIDYDIDDDGCNDANEVYSLYNADGGDNDYYGIGNPPPTSANGRVIAASYAAPSGYEKIAGTPIVVTTQTPENQRVNIGENATFTAVTTGSIFQ